MRAVIAMLMLPLLATPSPAPAEEAGFMLCEALPHITCVWSGDSFFLRKQLVRLSDIDAPHRYASECPAASSLSWKSALRLRDLLNAGRFELEAAGADDPELRLVTRNGKSLGAQLVSEGLAKKKSVEAHNWCG